jgi:lipopolysaccharide heptosyltransferase I
MTGEEPKRILIIKPSALGDIVLALPALSALRRSFPEARISWFVRPEFAPLLEGHPYISDVILFDRRRLSKWWCSPDSFKSLRSLVRELKGRRFDLVFDFQGLFRTGYFSWVTGCKRRFGNAQGRELAHLFYTDKISQDASSIHLVDYYLKMVAAAGAKAPSTLRYEGQAGEAKFKLPEDAGATDLKVKFVLPRVKEAADSIKRMLAQNNVPIEKYAVFVPGSAHKDKCWPRGRFAELAERIAERFGLAIVVCGSAGEVNIVKEMKMLSRTPIVDLAGKTTLKELVELLREARLVVSNDTGPGHIAAALGVPIVMIFGPTNPIRIMPYGRPECMAAREPYGRGTGIKSKDPRYSISEITVDEVFEKVFKQTKQR